MPDARYPSIGTNSTPYFIPSTENPVITFTDKGYFYLQIYSAQAAFSGSWWIGAQNLAITSQINLHLGENTDLSDKDVRSILQYRKIEKEHAVQLGFSPVLIDFVPAKMKKISVSIEYLVDTNNYLKDMVGIITDKTFLSPLSFAPGAALVAKTLSGLAEKIMATFIPAEERKPILQFSGEFDLAIDGLKEGYYVIFGSHTSKNPLPGGNLLLELAEGGLLMSNGEIVTNLSYVVLKIGCVKAIRDRLIGNSPWRIKLRDIKRQVQDYAEDPFLDKQQAAKKEFWEKTCLPQLRDVQTLLKADPNFLEEEIDLLYRSTYRECLDLITTQQSVGNRGFEKVNTFKWAPDAATDREFLGIPKHVNLEKETKEYSDRLYRAREVFNQLQ